MKKTLTAVIICVIIAICFAGCNGIKESKNPESTALSVSTEADAASDDTDEHINNDITQSHYRKCRSHNTVGTGQNT